MFLQRFTTFRFTSGFHKFDFKIRDFKNLKETKPSQLDGAQINRVIKSQQLGATWNLSTDSLSREIKFKDFKEAFSFMNQVAILAEQIDHHPDWENVYNVVKIKLNTHDVKGLSIKDLFLAHGIDQIAMNVFVKSAENTLDTRILEVTQIAQQWNHNFDQYQKLIDAQQI